MACLDTLVGEGGIAVGDLLAQQSVGPVVGPGRDHAVLGAVGAVADGVVGVDHGDDRTVDAFILDLRGQPVCRVVLVLVGRSVWTGDAVSVVTVARFTLNRLTSPVIEDVSSHASPHFPLHEVPP